MIQVRNPVWIIQVKLQFVFLFPLFPSACAHFRSVL